MFYRCLSSLSALRLWLIEKWVESTVIILNSICHKLLLSERVWSSWSHLSLTCDSYHRLYYSDIVEYLYTLNIDRGFEVAWLMLTKDVTSVFLLCFVREYSTRSLNSHRFWTRATLYMFQSTDSQSSHRKWTRDMRQFAKSLLTEAPLSLSCFRM